MRFPGLIITFLSFFSFAQTSLPLLDGYKSFKWGASLQSIANTIQDASYYTIPSDSTTKLGNLAGTDIFTDIQCLEISTIESGQSKAFKYLFVDSALVGLLYSNDSANAEEVISALTSKYGATKKSILLDTAILGFHTKSTIYEWRGQKGCIRTQVVIVDATALYDNYMNQQAYEMGASEFETEMANAMLAEQRQQLRQVSVTGPLYISNSFVKKQKGLSKLQRNTSKQAKPSLNDDF